MLPHPKLRALLADDWAAVDPALPPLLEMLFARSAGEDWHKAGTFKDHLFGVARILTLWNQPREVVLLGPLPQRLFQRICRPEALRRQRQPGRTGKPRWARRRSGWCIPSAPCRAAPSPGAWRRSTAIPGGGAGAAGPRGRHVVAPAPGGRAAHPGAGLRAVRRGDARRHRRAVALLAGRGLPGLPRARGQRPVAAALGGGDLARTAAPQRRHPVAAVAPGAAARRGWIRPGACRRRRSSMPGAATLEPGG